MEAEGHIALERASTNTRILEDMLSQSLVQHGSLHMWVLGSKHVRSLLTGQDHPCILLSMHPDNPLLPDDWYFQVTCRTPRQAMSSRSPGTAEIMGPEELGTGSFLPMYRRQHRPQPASSGYCGKSQLPGVERDKEHPEP